MTCAVNTCMKTMGTLLWAEYSQWTCQWMMDFKTIPYTACLPETTYLFLSQYFTSSNKRFPGHPTLSFAIFPYFYVKYWHSGQRHIFGLQAFEIPLTKPPSQCAGGRDWSVSVVSTHWGVKSDWFVCLKTMCHLSSNSLRHCDDNFLDLTLCAWLICRTMAWLCIVSDTIGTLAV